MLRYIYLFVSLSLLVRTVQCQFEWQKYDNFDKIREKLDKVNADNCRIVDVNDLFLDLDTVSHIPDIKYFGIDPIFPNRTNLLHVHNLAISRAFFYSYILQKVNDEAEPGFMYYFLSTIADVAANKFINASAIYYGPNLAFTPSYKGFYNKTMPLFAPRAYRSDDFNDPYHLSGTSTLNTMVATDLGAINTKFMSTNYTNEQYKVNEWYNAWLPDTTKRQDSKTTYTVQIAYGNGTNSTFVWHGPPAASDIPGPVKWTRPYFDCGRSNKWIIGATVPIPDIFPRHTGWRHIEIPINVAVSVIEMDFERLDINQCPIGQGNPEPNKFAGTARCKPETTECEPIYGFGFRRGGYQCRCRPGFRLPKVVRTPFLGEVLERANNVQHAKGFNCLKNGYLAVKTQNVNKLSEIDRQRLIGQITTATGLYTNYTHNREVDPAWVVDRVINMNARNCHQFKMYQKENLVLRDDLAFGKEQQFENQARMALRLANFISGFLQSVHINENFAEFRVPDKQLTEDQLIGEILSIVIGDYQIEGAGILFDTNQFGKHKYFAPYAYKEEKTSRNFYVTDLTRTRQWNEDMYVDDEFFRKIKIRWTSYVEELETFTNKIHIRYNSSGLYSIKYDYYPLQYKAAQLEHGQWSSPYFDCGGFHNKWLVKYGVPFFGWDKIKSKLEFKGIVLVNMRFTDLSFSQCEGDEYAANAFKNTHKCDRASSFCVPVQGRRFETPAYKCECKQGYEYPFNDEFSYFDGQVLEAEYSRLLINQPSRFGTLKCRIAAASSIQPLSILIVVSLLINLRRRIGLF